MKQSSSTGESIYTNCRRMCMYILNMKCKFKLLNVFTFRSLCLINIDKMMVLSAVGLSYQSLKLNQSES